MNSNNINNLLVLVIIVIIVLIIILIIKKNNNTENFEATTTSKFNICSALIKNPVSENPITYTTDSFGRKIYKYDYSNYYREIFYSLAYIFPGFFVCNSNGVFDSKDVEIQKINDLIQFNDYANDGTIYKRNLITINSILDNINVETFPSMFQSNFDMTTLCTIYEFILSIIPKNENEINNYARAYLLSKEIYNFKADLAEQNYSNINFELNKDNNTTDKIKIYLRTTNNSNKILAEGVVNSTPYTTDVCLNQPLLCYRETINIKEFSQKLLEYRNKLKDERIRYNLILYFRETLVYSLYLINANNVILTDNTEQYLPSNNFKNMLNRLYTSLNNDGINVPKHIQL
jgi:hypothetical protein